MLCLRLGQLSVAVKFMAVVNKLKCDNTPKSLDKVRLRCYHQTYFCLPDNLDKGGWCV
jgi:hypothetical protein